MSTRGLEPETGNTVGNLSSNVPLKIDPVSQGDDHLRATKRATIFTFAGIGVETVDLTAQDMNHTFARVGVGMTAWFTGPLPPGWYPLDGQPHNGVIVPNGIDKATKGTSASQEEGSVGGLNSVTLIVAPVALSASQLHPHTHTVTTYSTVGPEAGRRNDEGEAANYTSQTRTLSSSAGVSNTHTHAVSVRDNRPVSFLAIKAIYLGIEELG